MRVRGGTVGLKVCPKCAPWVPLKKIQQQRLRIPERLFGRTQTVVWAYANGCLGVRKR